MTTVDRSFESEAKAAILSDAEDELLSGGDNLAQRFLDLVHEKLRQYGSRHGYDVESTIDSAKEPSIERTDNGFRVKVEWGKSDQMARWEFGTSDHKVTPTDADVLSFVWEDPPQWVREEFDQARSSGGEFATGWRVFFPETEPSGIPESRAIRDSLNGLEALLS